MILAFSHYYSLCGRGMLSQPTMLAAVQKLSEEFPGLCGCVPWYQVLGLATQCCGASW